MTNSADKLAEFTDGDLLLELRRRKRFARIDSEFIIEGWRREVTHSPPREYVYERLCREIGHQINARLMTGDIDLPGRIEKEMPWTSGQFPSKMKSLQYRLPVNLVIMNPARDDSSTRRDLETFIRPRVDVDTSDLLKDG